LIICLFLRNRITVIRSHQRFLFMRCSRLFRVLSEQILIIFIFMGSSVILWRIPFRETFGLRETVVVWFGYQTDVLITVSCTIFMLNGRCNLSLNGFILSILLGPTVGIVSCLWLLFLLDFLQCLILFAGNIPAPLVISTFFIVSQIDWLIASSCEFFLCFQFIFDGLVHTRATRCPLDVNRVQVPHIWFVKCNAVLKGKPFWTFKYVGLVDFGVIKPIKVMPPTRLDEILLPSRNLGRVFFRFAIEPGNIRYEILFVERVGLMIGKLVVAHNKFKSAAINYNYLI